MRQFRSFNTEAYRQRLVVLRKLYDETQTEFARRLDIPFKKWNHYERGYPIPRETAFIIKEHIPDISIDWIWFGLEGNLSRDMIKRIRQAERDVAVELALKKREQGVALKQARNFTRKKAKTNGTGLRHQ